MAPRRDAHVKRTKLMGMDIGDLSSTSTSTSLMKAGSGNMGIALTVTSTGDSGFVACTSGDKTER